ncbi:hypothetical protein L208DRAFT_1212481, partial [Tricholoma matsutake]
IASPIARSLPIFWAHGRVDFSFETAETLTSELDNGIDGLRSRFVTYDQLGHWIVLEEMKDLSVWIESCVPHIK